MVTNPLNHMAIIMDGNGRWAKKNNVSLANGHNRGADVAFDIIKHSSNLSIPMLTLYALSTENLLRSKSELDGLFSIFNNQFASSEQKLKDLNIKLNIIGNLDLLSKNIANNIKKIALSLVENKGMVLNIAIAYGSRHEIIDTINKILSKNNPSPAKETYHLSEKDFSDNLYTKNCPDPDLIIRSGGEKRLSNFLLWQAAYSELFFSDVLWPDFNTDVLDQIILDYKYRDRKFGKSRYSD